MVSKKPGTGMCQKREGDESHFEGMEIISFEAPFCEAC